MRLKKLAGIVLALMLIVNTMAVQALAEPEQNVLPQIDTINSVDNTPAIAPTNIQSEDLTQKTALPQLASRANESMTHPEYITIPDKNGGYTVRYYDGTEEFYKLWKQYENYRYKPAEIKPTIIKQPIELKLSEPIKKSTDPDLANAAPFKSSEKIVKYSIPSTKITSPPVTKTEPKLLSGPTLQAVEGSTTISGTIKLPGGVLAPANGISGNIEIEDELGNYVTSTSFTIPENSSSTAYTVTVSASASGYVLRCYVYDNALGLWDSSYYNSTSSVSTFEKATLLNTAAGNLQNIDVTLLTSKKITGTISLPSGLTVPAGSSADISINLYTFNNNYWGYKQGSYVMISGGSSSANYEILLPSDFENTRCRLEYYISDDYNFNILTYGYFGPIGVTAFESDAEEISLAGQNNLDIDLAIPQLSTISGTISLPAGMTAPASGLTISVYADLVCTDMIYTYVDDYQSTIPAGGVSMDYTLKLPASDSTNGYRLRYYVSNSYNTELNEEGYYNLSGTVRTPSNASLINLPSNSNQEINFTLLEKKTISGTLTLPDNMIAPEGGLSVGVYGEFYNTEYDWWDSFGSSFNIAAGANSVNYSLDLPEYYDISSCYVYYSLYSTLPPLVEEGYYSTSGTVPDRDTAIPVDVSQTSTKNINIEVIKGDTISGIISLPDMMTAPAGGLDIEVSARKPVGTDDWTEVAYTTVTIDENASSAPYTLALAPDSEASGYWIYYYIYDTNNLSIVKRGYYNSAAVVKSYEEATLVTINTENINLAIPEARKITGRISLPGALTAPAGGLDINLSADLVDGNGVKDWSVAYTYASINENQSYADYVLMVPQNNSGEGYSIRYSLNNSELEILNEGYYSSTGTTVARRDNTKIDVSSGDAENVNFSIAAARVISGVISLPSNITVPTGGIDIDLTAESQTGEGSWSSIAFANASIDAGSTTATYKLMVPQNQPGDGYIITYNIYNTRGLNIISQGYFSESGITTNRSNAGIVDVSQGSRADINLNIPGGNLISGVISLPDGMLAPQNGLNVNLSVQEFQGIYDWSEITYKSVVIPAGSSSISYSIAIAPGSAASRVEYYVWDIKGLPIVRNGYYGIRGTTALENEALPIDAGFSDRNGIDIKLIKGKVLSGSIIVPSDPNLQVNNLSGSINVDEKVGGQSFQRLLNSYLDFGNASNNTLAYSIIVPEYVDEAIVYTDLYSTAGSNILRYAYYNTTGSVVYPEDAEIIALGASDKGNINIKLLTGNTVSGTVYLPSGLNISEPLYVSINIESLNQLKSYYSYGGTEIKAGSTSANYLITVPENLQFRLSYNIWQKHGHNIISRGYYTSAGTTPYRNSAEAITAVSSMAGANFNVLQGNTISGTVSMPNGEVAPVGGLQVNVLAYNLEANDSASLFIPAGANSVDYTLYLPVNKQSDNYKIYYYFYSTQVYDGYVAQGYYSTQGTTFNYSMITPVDISSQNAVDIDLTILKPVPTTDDVGNTPSAAFQLQLGAEKAAKLEYIGDVDYYTFTTSTEGAYMITSNSDMDMYGYLNEGSSDYRLVENDDYNSGDFRIIGNLRANTKYYIKARHYSAGTGDYIIMVNKVSSQLEGDVNKDYKVDIDDLVALALAYGAKEGEANYNSNADFNMDKVIDIKDLSTLAVNYGRMN